MSLRITAPSALFLDLDGTLVDSRGDIALACNAALVAHGRDPLPETVIGPMIGDGGRVLVARAFGIENGHPLLDAAFASFKASYIAHPCVRTTLLAGALDILEHARATGVPCAVVTNKPREVTLLLLARLGVDAFFRAIWAGGDGPLKPDPTGLLTVAQQLRIDPRGAWMIGDGPQDINAGKDAGCLTIGIPGIAERDRLVRSVPSMICASLVEVRDLVMMTQG